MTNLLSQLIYTDY